MTEEQNNYGFLGKRVLFLGCHLDDIELGCGGLIHHLRKKTNIELLAVTLSDHNENAKGETQLVRDRQEAEEAMNYLKMQGNYQILKYPGQKIEYKKQELRESLIQIKKEFNPSTVIFPSKRDVHQDHAVLSKEAFRIFRNVNCLGYEVVRSSFEFTPNLYIALNEEDAKAKINAVLEYRSQVTESAGYYFSKDIITSILKFRGVQAGVSLAEAYEVYLSIMKDGMEE